MTNDLLAGLDADANAEVVDLLGTIDDSGAPAWVPEEAGEGIQGTLRAVTDQDDEYKPGEKVPIWTVELSDGDKVRVIGFASVLRREMDESGAQAGDTVAVKYFGERELKSGKFKGRPYKHFKIASRRA